MTDKYAVLGELDAAEQERIADRMELRGRDPRQREMLASYVEDADLPPGCRVLEVGCGTGVVTRFLAAQPPVEAVVGVDPSPVLVERARELGADDGTTTFEEGDGRRLEFDDASFDAVVLHTVVCHVPETERLLAESHRVLRAGGRLLIFDGDYATTTVAVGEHDPLQRCIDAALAGLIKHPWIVRRLPKLAVEAGFEVNDLHSHGYTKTAAPEYLLSVIDVGAERLVESGIVGPELGEALGAEARRRVEDSEFYGFIGYASLCGRKATE